MVMLKLFTLGNSKDEARRICESFLKDCPDFYCVDYTKIYNK